MKSEKVQLLLGLHSHQPVGNFDFVFEDAYQKSYLPFIEVAEKYSEFKFTLHFTGALWEFFEEKHPEFLDLIGEMLARNQIELVISGFYEPVLASIPERDRRLQIRKAIEYIRKRFGERPKGLWLTERVYEADVLKTLVEMNLTYVVVDDYHFLQAGVEQSRLFGYYLTEFEGKKIAVFPINQTLRYLVPFHKTEEVIEYLKWVRENAEGDGAIIFDDGEKFGVWPGTYDWVYKKGWLKSFIESILSSDFIEPVTYSEYIKTHKPMGRIYLPSSSYFEMGEWSLPANVAVRFSEFVKKLKDIQLFEENRMFVKGGIWKNFLVKYSEANFMHKKMLLVSRWVEEFKGKKKKEAENFLLKAQANDAYWHGVFGGLYLPHLRRAVYENLLRAEKIVQRDLLIRYDIDADGYDEVYMQNGRIGIGITSRDGSVYEISLLSVARNLQDTLTRRFEHYHKDVKVKSDMENDTGTKSIHELERYVTPEVKKEMVYDWYERRSFIFHILHPHTSVEELRYMNFEEYGDFANMPYTMRLDKNRYAVSLHRNGGIYKNGSKIDYDITKRIALDGNVVHFRIRSKKEIDEFAGGVEFNLHFVKPVFVVEKKEFEGQESMFEEYAKNLFIKDDFLNIKVDFLCSKECKIMLYPVYTLSQSEAGMDMVYQGTSVVFVYSLGEKEFNIALKMEENNA